MAKDKYGIEQPGGNKGVWTAKKWKGQDYKLTWSETMAILALAGWPRDKWGMAGAVMSAESGRNPFIYNTYRQGHFGIFQISRSAWPDFFAPNGEGMRWVAPWENAAVAYQIYKKQGWGAWEAHTNGTYLAYYPQAMEAAANMGRKLAVHPNDEKGFLRSQIREKTVLAVIGAAGGDVRPIAGEAIAEGIAGAANATAEGVLDAGGAVQSTIADMAITDIWRALTTPALWMRLAYGVTGIALVVGGLYLIVQQTPVMKKSKSLAMAVIPGGKAAKGATS